MEANRKGQEDLSENVGANALARFFPSVFKSLAYWKCLCMFLMLKNLFFFLKGRRGNFIIGQAEASTVILI